MDSRRHKPSRSHRRTASPEAPRRKPVMLWGVAGLVAAALVAVILVTVGGGDDANHSPIEAGTAAIRDDENHPVAGHFGPSAYPFRVFVSDSGTVIGRFDGSFDTESLKTVLEVVAEV